MTKLLSIVAPIFNEAETIPVLFDRLEGLRSILSPTTLVEYIFIDDGSADLSRTLLGSLAAAHPHVKLIVFSRNFGHQIAITAGVDYAVGDHVAIIDSDLQDPPELIADMLRLSADGADIVYGKRRSRKGDSWFKRATASIFYRFLSHLCDIQIPMDTGDFRLMSRRAVDAFKLMRERHRFVRGMVPWIGFRSVPFEYDRDIRHAGATKYPLRKMIAFALNAVFAFSRKPLTVAMRLGAIIVILGVMGAVYMLYLKLALGTPVAGITAVLVTIVIFGGVQILLIGVAGEYIARIFDEVKGRPLYVIEHTRNVQEQT